MQRYLHTPAARARGVRWAVTLLLAGACAERRANPPEPPPEPRVERGEPDDNAVQPAGGQRPVNTGGALDNPRWVVPAGATPPQLSLRVGIDAGGGEPRVNAAGEVLINGPTEVHSESASAAGDAGFEGEYLPALTRRDAAGAGLWSRAYSPDARLFAALEADGSTLAAGVFAGSLNLGELQLDSFRNPAAVIGSASNRDPTYGRGQLSRDIAVFRLTPNGGLAWARRFGDAGDQQARAIEPTPAGGFVVVGQFEGELVMDGQRVLSSGGGASADVFIARFDAAGKVLSLWREEPLYVDGIAVDARGALWLAGREPNDLGANRVWRLGPDGQREVSLEVSSGGVASAAKPEPGPDGSLYVLYNQIQSESLLFGRQLAASSAIVRLSAQGEVEWLQPLASEFALASLAVDAAGNVTVAGAFQESIDSGAGPLASNGALDIFVTSYAPDGSLRYSFALGSPGSDGVNGIAARSSGRWLIPFYLEQPIMLGDQPLAAGSHLLWVDEL